MFFSAYVCVLLPIIFFFFSLTYIFIESKDNNLFISSCNKWASSGRRSSLYTMSIVVHITAISKFSTMYFYVKIDEIMSKGTQVGCIDDSCKSTISKCLMVATNFISRKTTCHDLQIKDTIWQ